MPVASSSGKGPVLSKKQAKKVAKAAATSQQTAPSPAVAPPCQAAPYGLPPGGGYPGYAVVPPPYQQAQPAYYQPASYQPAAYQPYMPPMAQFPGAGSAFGSPNRFGPPAGAAGGMFGFPGGMGSGSPQYAPPPPRPVHPEPPKSDQPMVTIKRVMRPDSR